MWIGGEAIDPMYTSEIVPVLHRGELVSWAEAGVAFGVVLDSAEVWSCIPFAVIPMSGGTCWPWVPLCRPC